MLEMLLNAYRDQFGIDFPLKNFEGSREIDLINIIYNCLQNNNPNLLDTPEENRFPDAPGAKK